MITPTNNLSPFKYWCQKVLPAVYDDSLSYYELLCKVVAQLNATIDAVNNNGDAVIELQNSFIELKNYVDNYFDSVDFQALVNNKLDEMAESGELTQIIVDYLKINGMIVFNNVTDLKNSNDLIENTTVQTLGYYELNDGGSAIYKIQSNPSEFYISLNNNLYANLIFYNELNVKQIGAKGNGTDDDTAILQLAFNSKYDVFIPDGNYLVSSSLDINTSNQNISSSPNAIIKPNGNFDILRINNVGTNVININIDGEKQVETDNTKYGIIVGYNGAVSSLITLLNCQITNMKQSALLWEQGSMLNITNMNIFQNTGDGIVATNNYNDNNHGFFNNLRITSNGGVGVKILGSGASHNNLWSRYHIFNNVKCFGNNQNFFIDSRYCYGTIFSEASTIYDELTSNSYGNYLIYMGDETQFANCNNQGNNTVAGHYTGGELQFDKMIFRDLRIKDRPANSGYRDFTNPSSLNYNDTIVGHTDVINTIQGKNASGGDINRTDIFNSFIIANKLATFTNKIKIGNNNLSSELERVYKGSIHIGAVQFNAGETKTFEATYLGVACVVVGSLANGNPGLVVSASNFGGSTTIYITNTTSETITTNQSCTINYIGIY